MDAVFYPEMHRAGVISLLLALPTSIVSIAAQSLPPVQTVFVIMMENTDWGELKGNTNAPYFNSTLLPAGSYCEFYNNVPNLHPSLPNYIWIEAGTNFGIVDDGEPAVNHQNSTNHLVTLLRDAGISWKAYQENISPTSLPLVTCCGYSARHNPFLYFDDVTGTNDSHYPYGVAHIRPYSELADDLTNNSVARYNFIIPSDCDDMHTACAPLYNRILQGDRWLSNEVPKILNSAAYLNGGALCIAWDESYDADTRIPFLLLSPFARGNGYSNTNYYDHGSLLRTLQEIFGVRPFLGAAATSTNLADLFAPYGFGRIERMSEGSVRLELAGLTVGRTNVLEISSDLSEWVAHSTNVSSSNTMIVMDHSAKHVQRRFYRLRQLP